MSSIKQNVHLISCWMVKMSLPLAGGSCNLSCICKCADIWVFMWKVPGDFIRSHLNTLVCIALNHRSLNQHLITQNIPNVALASTFCQRPLYFCIETILVLAVMFEKHVCSDQMALTYKEYIHQCTYRSTHLQQNPFHTSYIMWRQIPFFIIKWIIHYAHFYRFSNDFRRV